MIIIAGTLRIRADMREQALEIFQQMMQSSQAEAGCISYHFYTDLQDPTLMFVFEQWADETALQAHGWSPHMVEFRKARATFIAGDVNIQRYDVQQVKDA